GSALCPYTTLFRSHPWEDMNDRLSAIAAQAATVGDLASRVVVLRPAAAGAARALATAAYELASHATRHTRMRYSEGQCLDGELPEKPSFTLLDQCVDDFLRVTVEPEGGQELAESRS